jgi:hypothetical protein
MAFVLQNEMLLWGKAMSHFASIAVTFTLFTAACAHEASVPIAPPSTEKLPAVPSQYSLEQFQKSPLAKQCKLMKPAKKAKKKSTRSVEIVDYACSFPDAQVIVGFYKGHLREQNGIFSPKSANFAAIRDSLKTFRNDYYWVPFQAAESQPPPCEEQCRQFVYTSDKIVTKTFFKGEQPIAFWQENAAVESEFYGKIREHFQAATKALAKKKYKDCLNYVGQTRRMVASVDAVDRIGNQCQTLLKKGVARVRR